MPLGHRESGDGGASDLFAPEAKLCAGQIPEEQALVLLKPLLEDTSILKVGAEHEIRLAGVRPARHRDRRATTTPC